MGESLLDIDLSNSLVDVSHFEILFGRVGKLKVLKLSNCSKLDSACLKLITNITYRTLKELYLDHCIQMRKEPLLWMAGTVGINSNRLSRLKTLDLSYTPLEDEALEALASGIKLLRFLNLESCEHVTDRGVSAIAAGNPKLKVLNLSACYSITSKSVISIARSCPHLISLNLSRCLKVADPGIMAIGNMCLGLQALNIAGLRLVSEGALFPLAEKCKGLLMLNVTGCELVTTSGLRALITGNTYVTEAQTFMGFKPTDEHIERKLAGQLSMIRENAASKISHAYRSVVQRREEDRIRAIVFQDRCARLIQNYMTRYMMRVRFYYIWREKVKKARYYS
jgi:hypothetical protein